LDFPFFFFLTGLLLSQNGQACRIGPYPSVQDEGFSFQNGTNFLRKQTAVSGRRCLKGQGSPQRNGKSRYSLGSVGTIGEMNDDFGHKILAKICRLTKPNRTTKW
jgi:hypothetical protein